MKYESFLHFPHITMLANSVFILYHPYQSSCIVLLIVFPTTSSILSRPTMLSPWFVASPFLLTLHGFEEPQRSEKVVAPSARRVGPRCHGPAGRTTNTSGHGRGHGGQMGLVPPEKCCGPKYGNCSTITGHTFRQNHVQVLGQTWPVRHVQALQSGHSASPSSFLSCNSWQDAVKRCQWQVATGFAPKVASCKMGR